MKKSIFELIVGLLLVSVLLTQTVLAQDELPPADPSEPWFPSLEGTQNIALYQISVTSSGGGGPFAAYFTDTSLTPKTEFCGSQAFYLFIVLDHSAILWIAEYYPPGSSPDRHMILIRWLIPNPGMWMFGPFVPEILEPEGLHSWRIRTWDLTRGTWGVDNLARFDYKRSCVNTVPTATTINAPSRVSAGSSVPISTTVKDMQGQLVPGGSISVSYSLASQWTSVCSGTVTGGSFSCTWTPPDVGRYLLKADFGGYATQQTNYQPSTSQAWALEVDLIDTTISLTVTPLETSIDPNALVATVQLSGGITATTGPPVTGASVVITYASAKGVQAARTVTTDSLGRFTLSLTIDSVSADVKDDYTATASWQGDSKHKGSSSSPAMFSVKKVETKLDVTLDPTDITRDLILGASPVTVEGSLGPGLANVPIIINVKGPSPSSSITDTIQTESDGSFLWTFKPQEDGTYRITVSFDGDPQHAAISTAQMRLEVKPGYLTLVAIIGLAVAAVIALWRRGTLPIGRKPRPVVPPTRVPGTGTFGPSGVPSGPVCPTCGFVNRLGATFCTRDRTPLGPARTRPTMPRTRTLPQVNVCPSCNTPNRAGAAFCKRCRTSLR